MRKRTKNQLKASKHLNLNLFAPVFENRPAAATLYTEIQEHAKRIKNQTDNLVQSLPDADNGLPSISELYKSYERINWQYFDGNLPSVRIEYSTRMSSAGSYTPADRLIRMGRRYHQLFPEEIEDTLKHEMIHILNPSHNVAFKAEAKRIGASLRAKSHPTLQRTPRYLYFCDSCKREYPRQKRFRMASCGKCSSGGRYDLKYKLKLMKNAKLVAQSID